MAPVTIAHDYLTQRGGAERVVLSLCEAFPTANLVTTVYEPRGTFPDFARRRIVASPAERIGPLRRHVRALFPIIPMMLRSLPPAPGVLVASSSGWAHAIRANGPKVVYCHNPARWLYQPDDYFSELPAPARAAVSAALRPLRRWDRRHALSASIYLANSSSVARRIWQAYGISARVVFPPVGIDRSGPMAPVEGVQPGFFLTVGRRRGYKNTRAVCEAIERVDGARLVCVGGAPRGTWSEKVRGVQGISDAQLRWLYANAKAVVAVAREDFGLTPIEGHTFGTPSIVLRAGGYLDSCVEGLNSCFVESDGVDELAAAVRSFNADDFDPELIRKHAQRFSRAAFVEAIRAVVEPLEGGQPVEGGQPAAPAPRRAEARA
jgi:glycosyltransferase involved in cell wall biosynthesis